MVFEVLSRSSEGDDEGDKRVDFQSLASLQAYVVVAQDERQVRVARPSGIREGLRFRTVETVHQPPPLAEPPTRLFLTSGGRALN